MATREKALAGVIGFFDDPHALIEATKKARDANWQYFDAFTPFPVHGLEAAQGLRRSPIPYVTFVAGLCGGSLGFLLQYWTSAVDWPLDVGGKALNSWPAFIPITFELTVLLGALSTVAAMFLFNGLPNTKRRVFDPAVTRDKFALVIEAPPAKSGTAQGFRAFSESDASSFLQSLGAREVRSVMHEGWF